MIVVYSPTESDFSTLGLTVLEPTECTVEEIAGGNFELTLRHPVDDAWKWLDLQRGNILKAPCAAREAPVLVMQDNVPAGTTQTVTRAIYKVKTYTGKRLRLRAKPSTSAKTLGYYSVGTEVVRVSASGGWAKVVVVKNGASGYMSDERLQFVRNETQTVSGGVEAVETIVKTEQTRDQLFRIYAVEKDVQNHSVTAYARHIFYDLAGLIVNEEYAPENVPADAALNQILSKLSGTHDFTFHCSVTAPVSADYTGMSLVKALLDPEVGIVPKTGSRIIRDNFDVYILPDVLSDRGMEIRHKKNLLGATMNVDDSNAVTRIKPIGQDKDGNRLTISENGGWVESANIGLYPVPRDVEVEYDVRVGDGEGQYASNAAARAKLKELAQQDFQAGADAAEVSMDVRFVLLQNTVEYADYERLLSVFLYDTVRVIAKFIGIDTKIRVNGYVYDCLNRRYDRVQLGEITDIAQTVYGFDIAAGSVSGSRLIPGTVGGSALKNATIKYAKIDIATIRQLNAEAVNAITATINSLTAGDISTNTLYAAFAHVMELAAGSVQAGNIQTDRLAAALANIVSLHVATGDFDLATVSNLLSNALVLQQGVADSMMITNLSVTRANLLSAILGELVVKGSDGNYYRIVVGADGGISTEPATVTAGEISAGQTSGGQSIVETNLSVGDLDAQNIRAASAIVNELLVQSLNAGKITAGDALLASATIPSLYTTAIQAIGDGMDLSANDTIRLLLGAKDEMQRWFTFDNELGLLIQKPAYTDANGVEHPASIWRTITDETGYHIQRTDLPGYVASFARDRLIVDGAQIGDIVARKTASGGWAWVDA